MTYITIYLPAALSFSLLCRSADRARQAGDYPRAIERYSQIIRIRRNDPWAYANRGLVYHQMGDEEKAEADLTRAARLGG